MNGSHSENKCVFQKRTFWKFWTLPRRHILCISLQWLCIKNVIAVWIRPRGKVSGCTEADAFEGLCSPGSRFPLWAMLVREAGLACGAVCTSLHTLPHWPLTTPQMKKLRLWEVSLLRISQQLRAASLGFRARLTGHLACVPPVPSASHCALGGGSLWPGGACRLSRGDIYCPVFSLLLPQTYFGKYC